MNLNSNTPAFQEALEAARTLNPSFSSIDIQDAWTLAMANADFAPWQRRLVEKHSERVLCMVADFWNADGDIQPRHAVTHLIEMTATAMEVTLNCTAIK